MGDVHISFTRFSETFCALNRCPTCDRDRRMLGEFQDWYGTTWTCLGCGDKWTDGEMHDRPFCPGWRRMNVERARKIKQPRIPPQARPMTLLDKWMKERHK